MKNISFTYSEDPAIRIGHGAVTVHTVVEEATLVGHKESVLALVPPAVVA